MGSSGGDENQSAHRHDPPLLLEPGGAPAAGGFASLLPLSFPCLGVCVYWGACAPVLLAVWMKPNQCYTHRSLLVKLTCCVLLFLVLGNFPFPLHADPG